MGATGRPGGWVRCGWAVRRCVGKETGKQGGRKDVREGMLEAGRQEGRKAEGQGGKEAGEEGNRDWYGGCIRLFVVLRRSNI